LIDSETALDFLRFHDAPPRLLRHAVVVRSVAESLTSELSTPALGLDADLILAGAVLHDAGKLLHPQELSQPGELHEAAGRGLLLEAGFAPDLARICISHADWRGAETLEELIVALADKLWKGKREPELEQRAIEEVAKRRGESVWAVFSQLDEVFERLAEGGHRRLLES
jgi:putative nucleotidyltransferase with HDIG domain